MKILIDQHFPFMLGHGGANTQIEQTRLALEQEGVEAEFLRWFDGGQRGNLIHFFGTPSATYLNLARLKGISVVVHELFTAACNYPVSRLKRRGLIVKAIMSAPFGQRLMGRSNWQSYLKCGQNVVSLQAEKRVLETVYGVPPALISVVPIGLKDVFLKAGGGARLEPHLICTGTITERKCSLELAKMARAAQVPILFVGKPYSRTDPYWLKFKELIDRQWVKHHEHIEDEAELIGLLQSARGFVLMSWFENWCLSAHEAAACGLPLLVPDQNWSRERFGSGARYFSGIRVSDDNTRILKQFYSDAPQLAAPTVKQYGWREVARQLIQVYQKVLPYDAGGERAKWGS